MQVGNSYFFQSRNLSDHVDRINKSLEGLGFGFHFLNESENERLSFGTIPFFEGGEVEGEIGRTKLLVLYNVIPCASTNEMLKQRGQDYASNRYEPSRHWVSPFVEANENFVLFYHGQYLLAIQTYLNFILTETGESVQAIDIIHNSQIIKAQ